MPATAIVIATSANQSLRAGLSRKKHRVLVLLVIRSLLQIMTLAQTRLHHRGVRRARLLQKERRQAKRQQKHPRQLRKRRQPVPAARAQNLLRLRKRMATPKISKASRNQRKLASHRSQRRQQSSACTASTQRSKEVDPCSHASM